MREFRKEVSRDHWMARIQHWAFGIDAEDTYTGYCPFFWATWVAILVSPFVLIIKAIRLVDGGINKLSNVTVRQDDTAIRRPSRDTFEDLSYYDVKGSTSKEKEECLRSMLNGGMLSYYPETVKRWLSQNTGWYETYIVPCVALRESVRRRQERRTLLVNRIGSFLSVLVKPVLFVILFVVVPVALYYSVAWIISDGHSKGVMIVMGLFACGAVAFILPSGLAKAIPYKPKPHKTLPKWVSAPFRFIGTVVTFIFDTIELVYKKKCPLIKWGDTTGKIKKQ